MRVVISQAYLSLNKKLAQELNKLAKRFDTKSYSKIENIEELLFKRDISVEKKKKILIRKLQDLILRTFSINKRKFNKIALKALKRRLHYIREITIKLRSINYYLETTFLKELRLPKSRIRSQNPKLRQEDNLARGELEALEYTAYKLIMDAIVLDKRLLSEYSLKEKKIVEKGKAEIKDISSILKKESIILEHIEAKLPPPKAAGMELIKEPIFTHWVARVLALVSYLLYMYSKEAKIFSKLNENKAMKAKISKKITNLIREQSELVRIVEEKAISMKKLRIGDEIKKEMHNLTTTINL